jgi:hypothetical protein
MSGPAYVIALRNALEQRPASEYQSHPRTGGTQVSIRLDEFIFNHIDHGENRRESGRGSERPDSAGFVRSL